MYLEQTTETYILNTVLDIYGNNSYLTQYKTIEGRERTHAHKQALSG